MHRCIYGEALKEEIKLVNQKKEQASNMRITLNQTFPLTIKRLGINGEGVGYFKRQVVFVPGALPGEEIVVEATKVLPKFAEGKIRKIRIASKERVTPPCPVYEECGGCQLQHLSYNGQLDGKRDILIQSLERHTKWDPSQMTIHPTLGMNDPWRYRNKSQFQVSEKNGKVIAGLYELNSHKLINIPECIVQHPATTKATNVVKQILQDLRISPYNEKSKKGIVRTIVTRVGVETGEVQVALVTANKELPKKELFLAEMKNRLPEVVSIIQNVNDRNTSLIFGDETILLAGKEAIKEKLQEYTYELSARAFFQLNPSQTVKLYNEAKKAADLTGKEKVVDAYCGVGTIGLWLSQGAHEIRGMDIIEESIQDARQNAENKGLKNTTYEVGTAEKWLAKWQAEGFKPDVIVVDPPRTGLGESLIHSIKQAKPSKVVYISCNPSTLAKDLTLLSSLYNISYIQPVDMFPQTAQVESVTQLVLKVSN